MSVITAVNMFSRPRYRYASAMDDQASDAGVWAWPESGLTVSQEARGLRIAQHGRTYLAKNWRLSQAIRDVFELAFSFDLTHLLQSGHPSESKLYETGGTLDYVSFSASFEHFWVFAIDMDSCSGSGWRTDPRRVKFKRIYRHILRGAGIACPPEWRSPQNLHVAIEDLERSLRAVEADILDLSPIRGRRIGRGQRPYFIDEEDMHAFIVRNWSSIPIFSGLDLMASKRILNTLAHREGEIDVLAEDRSGNLFVIELKDDTRRRGTESPVEQIERYIAHREVQQMAKERGGAVYGMLVAQEVGFDIRRDIARSSYPIVAYEITKTSDGAIAQRVTEAGLAND